MKVLFATSNLDKFNLVRSMIAGVYGNDMEIHSLREAQLSGDVDEQGSMEERALAKATYFHEELQRLGRSKEYFAVLGSDDGIAIGGMVATAQSQEMVVRLLEGEWPIGTSVNIVRAFGLRTQDGSAAVATSNLPFEIERIDRAIKLSKGEYPLSKILRPLGFNKNFADLDKADQEVFNLKHSEAAVRSLFSTCFEH